jgi:hypothetical protein
LLLQLISFVDIRSDVQAVSNHTTWIAAAIIEELEHSSPIQFDSLRTVEADLEIEQKAEEATEPSSPSSPTIDQLEAETAEVESEVSSTPKFPYVHSTMSKVWGSFFHDEYVDRDPSTDVKNADEVSKGAIAEEVPEATFWNHFIQSHCKCALAISCLSDLEKLPLDTEFVWQEGSHACFHVAHEIRSNRTTAKAAQPPTEAPVVKSG